MPRNKNEYPVLLRKLNPAEGGRYLAEFADQAGCMADGATPEEALLELKAALTSYMASVKKHGYRRPAPAEGPRAKTVR